MEVRPNHTIYINNLNEKIKKDGIFFIIIQERLQNRTTALSLLLTLTLTLTLIWWQSDTVVL